MLLRRDVLSGFGGAAFARGAAPPMEQGEETWSESAMVLAFTPDLRTGVSFRLSRYPDRDRSWVWCHVLLDGKLYAYTDQHRPCAPARITADQPLGLYDTPGVEARITRLGASAQASAFSFSFSVRGHAGPRGIDGPGPVAIAAEGVFHPGPARHAVQPGRYEHSGRVEGRVSVNGRDATLSALGKAHEQTQTAPRFTTPFTYAMLWGPTASVVGLVTAGRSSGDLEAGGADAKLTRFDAGPMGERRPLRAVLADGSVVEGSAITRARYDVPVFDELWHGGMVQAQLGPHRMVGMINDWRPERMTVKSSIDP